MGIYAKHAENLGLTPEASTVHDYMVALTMWASTVLGERAADFSLGVGVALAPLGIDLKEQHDDTLKSLGGKGPKLIAALDKLVDDYLKSIDGTVKTEVKIEKYDAIKGKVKFEGGTKALCEAEETTKTKIASVYAMGDTYSGHGVTEALGKDVVHCHVTNDDGIAFRWAKEQLVIVAYGRKNDKAKKGNSGYDWSTK